MNNLQEAILELHKLNNTHCFGCLGRLNENITKIIKLLQKHEPEVQSCKKKLNVATKALEELGYYGIDFGYGPYRCNVAEVAQTALDYIRSIR